MPDFDISYDPAVRDRKFDYFPGGSGSPLLVFVHGGGWISGDKSMYHAEAEQFARAGISCACIGYRLAPLYPYPAAVSDVLAFTGYARSHAAELGIDPQKIVSMGNSAGGHLACMAGLLETDPSTHGPIEQVNGVVSVCAITDMCEPAESQNPIAFSFLEQFMGCSHMACPELWAAASPVSHVSRNDAPFLIFHGTDDEIVPFQQGERLATKLREAGVKVEFEPLTGEMHGFTLPAWERICSKAKEFVHAL